MEQRKNLWLAKAILSISLLSFCSIGLAKTEKHGHIQTRSAGVASFYSDKYHGLATTSGIPYDKNGLTAAHNSLPMGTQLRVTNLKNNRSVIVKVNDRMSKSNKHVVDLSKRAAKELGFVQAGLTKVKIEILSIA
ncbi:MAG: septal ring lytic transglycosylase RlpA family protein [Methylomonas sp.]|nr:septal ring lytic transglycosylase RlpA family protein [Methylomonas sp.]